MLIYNNTNMAYLMLTDKLNHDLSKYICEYIVSESTCNRYTCNYLDFVYKFNDGEYKLEMTFIDACRELNIRNWVRWITTKDNYSKIFNLALRHCYGQERDFKNEYFMLSLAMHPKMRRALKMWWDSFIKEKFIIERAASALSTVQYNQYMRELREEEEDLDRQEEIQDYWMEQNGYITDRMLNDPDF